MWHSPAKKERLNFYHRLGFAAEDTVQRYALDGLPEEKKGPAQPGRKNRGRAADTTMKEDRE